MSELDATSTLLDPLRPRFGKTILLSLLLLGAVLAGCAEAARQCPATGNARASQADPGCTAGRVETSRPTTSGQPKESPAEFRERILRGPAKDREKAIKELADSCGDEACAALLVELVAGGDTSLSDIILDVISAEKPAAVLPVLLSLLGGQGPLQPKLRQIILAAYEGESLAKATVETLRKKGRPSFETWSPYSALLVQSRSVFAVDFLVAELPNAERAFKTDMVKALESLTGQSLADEVEWAKWWSENGRKTREVWLEDSIADTRRKAANIAGEWLSVQLQAMKNAELSPEQIDEFLRRLLQGKDRELRRAALTKMLELEREYSLRLLPDILALTFEEQAEETRVLALRLLSVVGETSPASQIADCLKDQRPAIRRAAAQTLGKLNCPEAVQTLIAALSDPDPSTLAAVVESLGKLRSREALPRMRDILIAGDPPELLAAVVEAIGAIGAPESADALLAARQKLMADKRLRAAFAGAMGNLDAPGVPEALAPLLKDEFPDVRLAAVASLGKLRAAQLVSELAEVLVKDKEANVRRAAAVAIGQTGKKDAIPTLLTMVKQDEVVAPDAWQAALRLAEDEPQTLLFIADSLASSAIHDTRVRKLASELLRGLLAPARHPPIADESQGRARALLAKLLLESGEDAEAAQLLEQLHAGGVRSEWSETALMGAYTRTRQFKKGAVLCDDMLSRTKLGSARFWHLRLKKVSLLLDAGEIAQCREMIAALLSESNVTEAAKRDLQELAAKCDREAERLATAQQAARLKVAQALEEMLLPDLERRELAALEILELGRNAVPALLETLESGQTAYFTVVSVLLGRITGLEYPLSPASSPADLQQAVQAWRSWWEESR